MRGAFNLVDFPIEDGESLTDDPTMNMNSFLDHLEKRLFENWDQTSHDGHALLDVFETGPFEIRDLYIGSQNHSDERDYYMTISIEWGRTGTLFWQLLDPKGSNPELPLKFARALDLANLNFAHDPVDPLFFGSNPPRIALSDLPKWFEFFREELNKPLPPVSFEEKSAMARSREDRFEKGFRLDEVKRKEFENFLSGREFKQVYLTETEWPYVLSQQFFAFFPELTDRARLRIQSDEILQSSFDKYPLGRISSILETNGYKLFSSGSQVAVCRIVRTSVTSKNYLIRPPVEMITDVEPLAAEDEEVISSHWTTLLEDRGTSNFGFVPEHLMFVPFLCRRNLAGQLAETFDWMKPLIHELGDNANEEMARFAQIWLEMGPLATTDTYLPHLDYRWTECELLPVLLALNRMENPKAGISLLLFLALPKTSSGELLRQILPALFSRIIEWEVSMNDKKSRRGEMEIEVTAQSLVSTNAWNEWKVTDIKNAATVLRKVPDSFLKEVISDFDSELYRYYLPLVGKNYQTQENVLVEVDPKTIASASAGSRAYDYLKKKRLLRALHLKSTRDKIASLDSSDIGLISLQQLLNLSVTGPEREDLRRALQRIFRHSSQKALGHYTLDPAFELAEYQNGVSTVEILSIPVLKKLIRHSATQKRRPLWEALFQKSEREALELWADALEDFGKASDEENRAAFEQRSGYPNIDDLRNGFDFAMASQNPLSREIIEAHRDLLIHYGIPQAPAELKVGTLDYFDFALDAIIQEIAGMDAKSALPADIQWLLAVELSEFLAKIRPLYSTLDVSGIRVRLEKWLPPYLVNYVLSRAGFAGEFPRPEIEQTYAELIDHIEKLAIYPARDSFVTKNSFFPVKRKDNSHYYLSALTGLWDFLQKQPEIKSREDAFAAFATIFDFYLAEGLVSVQASEIKEILFELNEDPGILSYKLPPTFFIASMVHGIEWKFRHPTRDELFRESSEGPILKPGPDWWDRLEQFSIDEDSFTVLLVFINMRTFYGPFQLEGSRKEFEALNILSAYHFDGPYPPITPLAIKILAEYKYRSPASIKILITLRFLDEEGRLDITDDETAAPKEEVVSDRLRSLIYPESELEELFYSMARFDDIAYPTETTEKDSTGFQLGEIDHYGFNIAEYYENFFYSLKTIVHLKHAGYPISINLDAFRDSLPKDKPITPWLNYAFLLVQYLSGAKGVLEELWEYHEQKKTLKRDSWPFKDICNQLLYLGRQILLYEDPDRFFFGKNMYQLESKALMGMIEFAHPDPKRAVLKDHLDNPQTNGESVKQADINHASQVAQVMLGNPGPEKKAMGKVRSYVLPQESENFWKDMDRVLSEVLKDIENGKEIRVCNMSTGIAGGLAAGLEFEQLMNAEEMSRLRDKIDSLHGKKVPLVVAAGNEGRGASSPSSTLSLLLHLFNFYGISTTGLIFVGATAVGPLKITAENDPMWKHRSHPREEEYDMESLLAEERISEFSSPGGILVRPDISAPGEGYTLWLEKGLEENIAGTSFSSPFVARLVALMKSLNPHLSVERIQAILKLTAQDLKSAGPNREGAGALRPKSCLYLAYAARPFRGRKSKREFAKEIGITEQERKYLDWLGRKMRGQVFFKDTMVQSYGE